MDYKSARAFDLAVHPRCLINVELGQDSISFRKDLRLRGLYLCVAVRGNMFFDGSDSWH